MATERSPQDFAIEFGGYLATAAERLMTRINQTWPEADDSGDFGEEWRRLESAIYEFRKRATRATTPE